MICKYISLEKCSFFEITVIKNNDTIRGPMIHLEWLQQFIFITFLSVFLSAFPSHNVHLIYLANRSDLWSFPVSFSYLTICADGLVVASRCMGCGRVPLLRSTLVAQLQLAVLAGCPRRLLSWEPAAAEYTRNLKATYCGVSKQSALLIPGLQCLKAHKNDEHVERILCPYIHREFCAPVLLALVM